MSTLQPFTFPDTGENVRTLNRGGEAWFVAKDACDVIGIKKYRDAIAQLDDDERVSMAVDTPGGQQVMTLVNEPGVYALMLISRSPKVKPFRRWVTHEVLPSIRRTGGYQVAPAVPQAPQTYAEALRALADQHEATEAERQRAEALEPDAEFTRRTADAEGLRLVGQVAKAWGMQEKRLREYLYAEGLLIRGGDRRNDPTAYAIERDWLVSKARMAGRPEQRRWTTYVTPRGEVGIWRRRYSQGLEDRPHPPSTQLSLVAGGS